MNSSQLLMTMSAVSFADKAWLLALLVLPVVLLFFRKKGYLGYSHSRLVTGAPRWARWLSRLPTVCLMLSLALTILALAKPQVPGEPLEKRVPGRDIELVVDISFSMSFPFQGKIEPHEPPEKMRFQTQFNEPRENEKGLKFTQPKEGFQRIHAAQDAILRFIENRWEKQTGDRMGLIVFDVRPRLSWPITDDLRMLYRKTQTLQNHLGTGTNFGQNFPGPIDLAVQHFKDYGQAKSKVIIMVTDGEVQIDSSTVNRLITIMRENNVRFYLIGIGETLAHTDVDIYRVANGVGGKIFRVEDSQSLNAVFAQIDRLEKSEVSVSQLEVNDDVYHIFVWGALVMFLMFLLSEAFIMSR
jgi:Ca-activated chloride channel family protein